MKDKTTQKITPGGKRTLLADVLPLDTPFLIQVFPVYACNFRCNYCLFALPKAKHGFVSDFAIMDFDIYKKCIDDMSRFNSKIKMLRFAGIGEPLLHKDIATMIKYAKDKNVAQNVDIVTNAALLDKNLSLALVDSRLDKLRISIQAVTAEKYNKMSGVEADFKQLLSNIEFFYKNKGSTKVYIKIIDSAISDQYEAQEFYSIFGEMSDTLAIEHMTPTVEGIDYKAISGGKENVLTQSGNEIIEASVCAQPFYMMQINPDAKIVPCCSVKYPRMLGDASIESLSDIWNGDKFNRFRRELLDGVHNAGEVCSKCVLYKYGLFEEDILDAHSERLKELYNNQ